MKATWTIDPKKPISLTDLAGMIATGRQPPLTIPSPIPMTETTVYPNGTETTETIHAGPITEPEPTPADRTDDRLRTLENLVAELFRRVGPVKAPAPTLTPEPTPTPIKIGDRVRVTHGRTNPRGLEGIVYGIYPNPQYTTVYCNMDDGRRLKDYARNLTVI